MDVNPYGICAKVFAPAVFEADEHTGFAQKLVRAASGLATRDL